ncbi:MAG: hypothetical protein J6Q84_02665 [Kiritimatiellae bacterium]|nr:hypothetical protein [Kiritimatiellia bacterium]
MQGKDEMRGASIAKGMRSCCSIFFVPIFSIVGGIAIGQYSGVWTGIFSGMILLVASFWGLSKLINKNCTGLSITDCFLPTIISIFSGIVFFPVSLFSGNLFSPATCIISGVLLTVALFGYRSGKIDSAGWLVLPFLTFIYEILPIDLPTDLDNLLGLGATTVIDVVALCKSSQSEPLQNNKYRHLRDEDVIDI